MNDNILEDILHGLKVKKGKKRLNMGIIIQKR